MVRNYAKIKKRIIRRFYDLFPAMSHRNYRLFWFGQLISVVGTWMQNAALSWIVFDITHDEFKSGLMSAVQFLPMFIFSLHAGVVIEEFPKRKLIILTQFCQLISAVLLFIFLYFGKLKYEYILIIMFFVGVIQAIDNPARQSFVVEMVENKEHLLNAIALNSAAFNGARLIGPAVAGLIMANLGAKWCFFLNAVSFVAVIIGLLMMNIVDKPTRVRQTEYKGNMFIKSLRDIGEGLGYIKKSPKILFTILAVAIVPTFCINFNVLIPIYTVEVLKLGESSYSVLLSCLGFGAMVSAIIVATKGRRSKQFYYQVTGCMGLGIFLTALCFTRNLFLASIILIFCGFSMIMFTTTSNSIIQLNAPDNMRGRIMSVYSLVFGGFVPIGSLYAGYTAKYLGVSNTFLISGIIGFAGFIMLMSKRRKLK